MGIIRQLVEEGHTIYALAPRDAYTEKLIAAKVRYLDIPLDNYGTNPLRDLYLTLRLIHLYRKYNFDRIFHYTIKPNIYGSLAAYYCGISSIAVTTGLGKTFAFKNVLLQKTVIAIYRHALKHVDEVWMLNRPNYERLIDSGIANKDRSFILPSEGINTKRFRPLELESTNSPAFRFLFAGRLLKEKGVYDYIAAARILQTFHPDIRCEILGFLDPKNKDTILSEELNQWQEEGIINYLGSTEDVRPYIARANCLVLPSYYEEGVSRILLEAASMATPIITTDHVGCNEVVVDHHNGFLIQPKHISQLVSAMGKMLQLSKLELDNMGKNGRLLVQSKYAEKNIVSIYKQVIDGVPIQDRHLWLPLKTPIK